jgi:hypothetical protein
VLPNTKLASNILRPELITQREFARKPRGHEPLTDTEGPKACSVRSRITGQDKELHAGVEACYISKSGELLQQV